MGYPLINVQLPDSALDGAALLSVLRRMEAIALKTPRSIGHTFMIPGQSLLLSAFGSNFGSIFVMLNNFDERPQPTSERFYTWYAQTGMEDWWRDRLGWAKPKDVKGTFLERWSRKAFGLKQQPTLNSDATAAFFSVST